MRRDISALRISPSEGSLPKGAQVQLGLYAVRAAVVGSDEPDGKMLQLLTQRAANFGVKYLRAT